MPVDLIVIGVVMLLVGASAWYVIRQKKNGAKCIGCPDSKTCSGKCSGCSGNCGNHQ